MSGHTPGPWEIEEVGEMGMYVTGSDRRANVICDIVARDADGYTEEDEANARLIAAAPELLEELVRALEWLEIDPLAEERGVVDDIRDAIAKATGGES